MRRWPIMAVILAVLAALPPRGTDIGELRPVSLLYVYQDRGLVCVATDTGDSGRGAELKDALEDLKQTTPGTVFLDTAQYLVLTRQTLHSIPELSRILRPSVKFCMTDRLTDTEAAAKYLHAHAPEVTLLDLRTQKSTVPTLMETKGRYHLETDASGK